MWYRTGTISVTNGSTAVTGSGTAWIANAGIGEAIYGPDGRLYEIAAIVSNTSITLASNYLGSTVTGQTYVIVPSQSYIRDLANQAAELINSYADTESTIGQGLFPDGSSSSPSVKFTTETNTGFYKSATNEVTYVSNGIAQFKYNLSGLTILTNFILPSATTPAQTAEGSVVWDSDSDLLTVGTGAGRKTMVDTDSTQTLTNKTLTSPNLSNPSISGTIAGASLTLTGNTTLGDAAGDVITINGAATFANVNPTLSSGTANGVVYLNGSKVATTGNALTFDGTNLGIGTSSPSYKLDVAGTSTGAVGARFLNNNATGVDKYVAIFAGGTSTGITDWNNSGVVESAVGNNLVLSGYNGTILFQTGTSRTTRATLDSSGNLGLGVKPSGNPLSIGYASFSIKKSGNTLLSGTNDLLMTMNAVYNSGMTYAENGVASAYSQNAGTHKWLIAPSGTAGNAISFTQAMTLDASGLLMLGTTTASAKLTVLGGDAVTSVADIVSGKSNTVFTLANPAIRLSFGYSNDDAYIQAFNNTNVAADNLQLNPFGGNVGIGTSSPGQKLHVVSANPTGGVIANLNNSTVTSSTGAYLQYGNDGVGYWKTGIVAGANAFAVTDIIYGERMRIDSSGNLGLGVTPSAWISGYNALDVGSISTLLSTGAVTWVGNNWYVKNTGVDTYKTSNYATRYAQIATIGAHAWYTAPSGTAGNAISFTQAMTLDASGNLGVGTSSPTTKITSVYGVDSAINGASPNANTALTLGGTDPGTIASGYGTLLQIRGIFNRGATVAIGAVSESSNKDANHSLVLYRNSGNGQIAESLRIRSSGTLEHYGPDSSWCSNASANYTRLDLIPANGGVTYRAYSGGTDSTPAHIWNIQGSERMRIDSSGNVLVGRTSGSYVLDVLGSNSTTYINDIFTARFAGLNAYNSGNSGAGIEFGGYYESNNQTTFGGIWCKKNNTTSGDYGAYLAFGTRQNGTGGSDLERMRITSGGEVYIAGTTDQGAYNLQCNGTGVWGAGAYVNGSDAALKENVTTLDNSLGLINAMRPVTFTYKEDYSKDRAVQTGFIAQELQEVLAGKDYLDGIVQAGPEHLNVAYQNLIPLLVKAVQELTARVAQLEGN